MKPTRPTRPPKVAIYTSRGRMPNVAQVAPAPVLAPAPEPASAPASAPASEPERKPKRRETTVEGSEA